MIPCMHELATNCGLLTSVALLVVMSLMWKMCVDVQFSSLISVMLWVTAEVCYVLKCTYYSYSTRVLVTLNSAPASSVLPAHAACIPTPVLVKGSS